MLKAEIIFKRENIENVFKTISIRSADAAADYFDRLVKDLEYEKFDLDKAVHNARETLIYYKLRNEEVYEIENAVKAIGKYDAESQSEMLQSSLERIKSIYNKASLEEEKNSRLFKTIGVAFGIVLSLLLL